MIIYSIHNNQRRNFIIKNNSFIYFISIILFISNINKIKSVIYLPFKTRTKNILSDEFFSKYLSTNFAMGTPPQNIEAEIDFQEMDFHLSYTRKYLSFSYDKSLSSSYINTTKYDISTNNFLSGCRANESFYFFSNNDLSTKLEYKNIPFFMSTINNYKFGAVLGFAISWKGLRNFVYSLKYGKAINSYTWTLVFNNLNEGKLIIGDEPHIYNNSYYDENKLKYTKLYKESNKYNWCFEFNKIMSENSLINNNGNVLLGIIRPEINGIVAPWEYYLNLRKEFFDKYLKNNICKEISVFEKNISINDFYNEEKIVYNKIECFIDDININNFPLLKFVNIPLNYSFNFSGNDLFLKENDKYIFQIYFTNVSYWFIGRIFLYKYQLIFNEDNKLIGFYTAKKELKEKEEKMNNFFKISLIIIISIFCLFLIFVIYKRIKFMIIKNSKKNAKELEEDFSYKKSDNEIDNNYNNNENRILSINE